MQITANTTGMPAELTVATDKTGRDHCVVVVKGTFAIEANGDTRLAEEQEPLVFADLHHGDPGETSIKYECDFAPFKPRADIIVNGRAMSPTGQPVSDLMVGLMVGDAKKLAKVHGDRHWEKRGKEFRVTPPEPFVEMPLVFERAYGGSDHSHPEPEHQGTEMRNPVGVGYRMNPEPDDVEGTPLPNIEDPQSQIQKLTDRPEPAGFGAVGRGWQPRIAHAGTYDDAWLENCFPFLPEDFDEQYFLSAPIDQQTAHLKGGEIIQCANMSPGGRLRFKVPELRLPALFRFRDRDEAAESCLDTVIIEPDQGRVMLAWRARVELGRKFNALREIQIGPTPATPRRRASGKPHFRSLSDYIAWKNRRPAAATQDEK